METANPRSFWRLILWLSGAFFSLFLLYVLSVGPAVFCCYGPDYPPRWFLTLYAPLIATSKQAPIVERFFDWYGGFWIDLAIRRAHPGDEDSP